MINVVFLERATTGSKRQLQRAGKQEPRYNFFLNPYLDCRFTTCPICERSMRQRKLLLVVDLNEPKTPMALEKMCRYCPECDLLIAHENEMNESLSDLFDGKKITTDDYMVIGTLDRRFWKKDMNTPLSPEDIIDNRHDFEDVVDFEARGGWLPAETWRALEKDYKKMKAAWRRKVEAQKRKKK